MCQTSGKIPKVETRILKGRICLSHHFIVTDGGELLYLWRGRGVIVPPDREGVTVPQESVSWFSNIFLLYVMPFGANYIGSTFTLLCGKYVAAVICAAHTKIVQSVINPLYL